MKPLPFKMQITNELEQWRHDTFWEKEPETIAWIDTFKPGDLFFDVGANIGIYSLYAASRGVRVVAFEPEINNCKSLYANLEMNGFNDLLAFGYAIGARQGIACFLVQDERPGNSGGSMKIGTIGMKPRDVYVMPLDDLVFRFGKPAHIKIDIDGREDDVIRGMRAMLSCRDFETCLIEVSPENKNFVVSSFATNGYILHHLNEMTPHSRERREREGIKVENIIFVRGK